MMCKYKKSLDEMINLDIHRISKNQSILMKGKGEELEFDYLSNAGGSGHWADGYFVNWPK